MLLYSLMLKVSLFVWGSVDVRYFCQVKVKGIAHTVIPQIQICILWKSFFLIFLPLESSCYRNTWFGFLLGIVYHGLYFHFVIIE